ncbi:protein phosphatase regulator [Coemansia javaensis]|uniref:Protein phosphatase regulator n=1 Tax=Coemansia javaensis TaxID=2761396 RepID=A0A9W8LET1_9FUNG|nr:protein phosphatase regulator [Coemansia javaensis]
MSTAAEQDELVRQWLAVNPGDEGQARFYLEANNWDLNAALSNFYENPPLSEGLQPSRREDAVLPPDPLVAPAAALHPPAAAPADAPASAPVPRRRQGSGARIATLSSLNDPHADDADDADPGAPRPQEWYAGGGRSAMAVQAPGHGPDDSASLVDRILRRASEAGPAHADHHPPATAAAFAGRGRILEGGADSDADADADADADSDSDSDDGSGGEIAVRELTFWRNGFSIGDGPLYNLEDPANRQTLEAILQGRAPLDVLNVRPGQRVEMKIAVRRGEDYAPPPPAPTQPFAGRGQRLGGISPPVATAPPSAPDHHHQPPPPPPPPSNVLVLDPALPAVQVQIRLADGTRLVARANPSHTVADLRAYVAAQRPAAAARPFALKSVMPPKVLDDAATIESAGIANATVAQQFL